MLFGCFFASLAIQVHAYSAHRSCRSFPALRENAVQNFAAFHHSKFHEHSQWLPGCRVLGQALPRGCNRAELWSDSENHWRILQEISKRHQTRLYFRRQERLRNTGPQKTPWTKMVDPGQKSAHNNWRSSLGLPVHKKARTEVALLGSSLFWTRLCKIRFFLRRQHPSSSDTSDFRSLNPFPYFHHLIPK